MDGASTSLGTISAKGVAASQVSIQTCEALGAVDAV